MSRMLSDRFGRGARALALCAAAGACLGLVSCRTAPKRPHKAGGDQAVNTGLSALGDDPGLALPQDKRLMETSPEKSSIQSQIEESARQLSVYFANLEIDGADPVSDSRRVMPAPARGGPGAASIPTSVKAPAQDVPGSAPAGGAETGSGDGAGVRVTLAGSPGHQPNPDLGGAESDGGVRVSLMGAAGDSEEPDSAGKGPAGDAGKSIEPEPEAPLDPVQRRDALVRELAGVLSELAVSGDSPGSAALALASLETILPKDVGSLVDQGVLSDAEKASLDAAREVLRSMQSQGEIASPAAVSEKLDQIKAELDSWAGLTIKRAALCTSVQGYGRYETFPSYRFIAGRPQEVIVYTELERFAQRQTTGPDGLARYETSLSQRLELYHVADDLNTWNRGAESVNDETRNRLRDYYLINQVTLPGNLGVGRYHLKIVMRDLIGDKVAETIIPIEIVAR